MTATQTLQVRVRASTHEAQDVLAFELVPLAPATELPAFTAGSHIDLHLPAGLLRSYSLLNDPAERHRYQIGVHRHPASRGGSRYLHEDLRTGSVLTISAPRNNFLLDERASHHVFIAGGIGITPMLSMIHRAQALGTPWVLYYSARTREHAAFVDRLTPHGSTQGSSVVLNFDHEPGGKLLDLAAIVRDLPAQAHVYCCGPSAMLEAFERATATLAPQRVHREYFAATDAVSTSGGYTVELRRSGKTIAIRAGQTLLDGLIDAGVEPMHSCRQGVCGTCEVTVLAGDPDHRDLVLNEADRLAGNRMMACCSGSKSSTLVLDL